MDRIPPGGRASDAPQTFFDCSVDVDLFSVRPDVSMADALATAMRHKRIRAFVSSQVSEKRAILNLLNMKVNYGTRDVLVHMVEPGVSYDHTHAGVRICVKRSEVRTLCVYGPQVDCSLLLPVGNCNLFIRTNGSVYNEPPATAAAAAAGTAAAPAVAAGSA